MSSYENIVGLNPLEAYNMLMHFGQRSGEGSLRLAMHAAVPQSLRPNLLHLLRLNFVPRDLVGQVAEADVLLAPFCLDLGGGYYQFDPTVRRMLLGYLQEEYPNQGRGRVRQVADMLLRYIEMHEHSATDRQDRLLSHYLETQRWVALAFQDPDSAAAQIAASLEWADRSGQTAVRLQVGGLAGTLTLPLNRYSRLLAYAAGVQALESGQAQQAFDLFRTLGEAPITVGSTTLRSPNALLTEWTRHQIESQESLRGARLSGTIREAALVNRDLTDIVLDGNFISANFTRSRLDQAKLEGNFVDCDFSTTMIKRAVLNGNFVGCKFYESDFSGTLLNGVFSRCDFRGSLFRGTTFENSDLVQCDLTGATITEEQLRYADRLRATILPDSSRYDGRYVLSGDVADAQQAGYDITLPNELTQFYSLDRIKFGLQGFTQGHALVIGIGSYASTPALDVPITVSDAQEVAKVLTNPELCSYPPEQTLLLTGSLATRRTILDAFDNLALQTGVDDTVLVFYSGHSYRDREGQLNLTAHDTQFEHGPEYQILGKTGIRPKDLIEKLSTIKARRVSLFVNTAISDNTVSAILGTGEGRVVITACRESEESLFDSSQDLTFFAQALVRGLQGEGVRNQEGFINLFDLYAHVYNVVSRSVKEHFANRHQTPVLTVLQGVGPFAIGRYHGNTSNDSVEHSPEAPIREIDLAQSQAEFLRLRDEKVARHNQSEAAATQTVWGEQDIDVEGNETQAQDEMKGRRAQYEADAAALSKMINHVIRQLAQVKTSLQAEYSKTALMEFVEYFSNLADQFLNIRDNRSNPLYAFTQRTQQRRSDVSDVVKKARNTAIHFDKCSKDLRSFSITKTTALITALEIALANLNPGIDIKGDLGVSKEGPLHNIRVIEDKIPTQDDLEDRVTQYEAASFSKMINQVITQLQQMQTSLQAEYSKTALIELAEYFSNLADQFLDIRNNQSNPLYAFTQRAQQRQSDTTDVIKKTRDTAGYFERCSKKPQSFIRTRAEALFTDLQISLDNLKAQ